MNNLEPNHEFIFTSSGNLSNDLAAHRRPHPHVPMDRWVKCHLIGDRIVLGRFSPRHTGENR